MSTLIVSTSADFIGRPLLYIDTIEFASSTTATFGGWQFVAGKISANVLIDGSSGTDAIVINCNVLGFDASGWQFYGWSSTMAPGQLRYFHDSGQTIVEADGDGTPDMQIALSLRAISFSKGRNHA